MRSLYRVPHQVLGLERTEEMPIIMYGNRQNKKENPETKDCNAQRPFTESITPGVQMMIPISEA